MPRQPRLLLPKSFYHVITRGNNRNIVFKAAQNYQYYLNLIARFKKELPFELYHYCLMPNHVHLLIQTKSPKNFSGFMKKINLAYFHHYKNRYSWVGHFWQDRFLSQPVGKDNYFIQCGKYIELNPVRANLVKAVEDYPWSSYAYYAQGVENPLLSEDIFYQSLGQTPGERQTNYRNLLISDLVKDSYIKKVWGTPTQRHNETVKIRYHLRS